MRLWSDKESLEENVVDNIAIKCSNCRKTTGLSVKKTNHKDMITKFVLNSVLHHFFVMDDWYKSTIII